MAANTIGIELGQAQVRIEYTMGNGSVRTEKMLVDKKEYEENPISIIKKALEKAISGIFTEGKEQKKLYDVVVLLPIELFKNKELVRNIEHEISSIKYTNSKKFVYMHNCVCAPDGFILKSIPEKMIVDYGYEIKSLD